MEEKKERKPNEFHFILGFLVIMLAFVCWMNFGPMLSFGIMSIRQLQEGTLVGLGDYLIVHAPYILMFLALFLGSNFILKTKLRELIAGNKKYRYKYSFIIGGIYIILLIIVSLFSIKSIELDPTPLREKLILLLPILILTPMQAISEEIFFRALPARIVYHDTLPDSAIKSIPIVLASGLLFMIPHLGNPEVSVNAIASILYYFIWGAAAMALGIYTGGFEAPVAMHIANNLYIALIVNNSVSAMPTHAIFINKGIVSSIFVVIEAIIVFAIIFAASYFMKKHEENNG